MAGIGEQIRRKAIEIIKDTPEGIRYGDLRRRVKEALPDANPNTIQGNIWDLDIEYPQDVYKPVRGLYRSTTYRAEDEKQPPPPSHTISEESFYAPFAEWLVREVEECTEAVPLGGSRFRDKWGTPDVLGKWESPRSDIVKGSTEIVSAEIKIDSGQLVTAFGQSCAYKIFSHKSYLVVPKASNQDDLSRLDSLCQIFGIGLVLFDSSNTENPGFEIRVRAARHEPDMFYVNKYAREVEKELFR